MSAYSASDLHTTTNDGFSGGAGLWKDIANVRAGFGKAVLDQIKAQHPSDYLDLLKATSNYDTGVRQDGYVLNTTVSYFVYTSISDRTNKDIISVSGWPVGMPHIQKYLEPDFRFKNNTNAARTMDILVNLGYVMEILDSKIDKNGDIDTLKFLRSLMDGIGGALGGINDFEVTFDDVDNTFRIIDNTYVANSGKDNITELQINTLTANSGTFVKDVNLKTELTARIANAITAGAQKNGNTMVSNGTTFAKFNEGYVDRIIEKIIEKVKHNSNDIHLLKLSNNTLVGDVKAMKDELTRQHRGMVRVSNEYHNGHSTSRKDKIKDDYRKLLPQMEFLLKAKSTNTELYLSICKSAERIYKKQHKALIPIAKMFKFNSYEKSIDELMPSYIHMFINRFYNSNQRFEEFIIYQLLEKYYKSQLARAKYNS